MTRDEFQWAANAERFGGSFVRVFALACLYADEYNYAILRPALTELMAKYPIYSVVRDNEASPSDGGSSA